ncbi:MAG: MBL fold metallo-hydrolase [Elusimicrobiaceae bacterium]|nr:MBL fold metallo-hydrolase [Elusimicrobiaceae bacterium]
MAKLENNFLIIHRGTKEIGGSCLEIAQNHTHILFDFGLPLSSMTEEKENKKYRLNIPGIYKDSKQKNTKIKVVFITHAHPDHYGLLSEISPKIPIYLSRATYNLITKIAPLIKENHIKNLNFKIIKSNEEIIINKIKIQALAVDHSAPEALAYKITINNKTLVYSGDLRAYGYNAYKTENFIKQAKNADYLILEGTTLGRQQKPPFLEKDLTKLLEKEFSKNKLNLIYFSSQNLDRFVSVYKAVRKTKKILVIDPYTCAVLENLKTLSKNIPQYFWQDIRIYFANNKQTAKLDNKIFTYKKQKITLKEILENPNNFVLKANFNITQKVIKNIKNINLIHSAWQGYLTEDNIFIKIAKKHNLKIKQIHTSGHADIKTLQKIVQGINPKQIIPIHTEFTKKYKKFFGDKITLLKDEQILPI